VLCNCSECSFPNRDARVVGDFILERIWIKPTKNVMVTGVQTETRTKRAPNASLDS
jgi:hypothetical protein